MRKLKVSVIGLRGHAQKHIQSLLKRSDIEISRVLYDKTPPVEYNYLPTTRDINDCFLSDAIIISTPTPTHYSYMRSLLNFKGYIFLEKPAVNTAEHIESLIQFPDYIKKKTQINFNFIFHKITQLLEDLIQHGTLGRTFALDIHTAHGIAFKSEWQGSWRITSESTLGPMESTGVHFLHLSERLFGPTQYAHLDLISLSNNQYCDTGILNLNTESGVRVRIRHSYAAPYKIHIELHGTDGYFIYDGENACLYGPRDTFDDLGLYTKPPLLQKWAVHYPSEWDRSLVKSQNAFLKAVRDRKLFDPVEFDRDVNIMNTLIGTIP